MITKYQTFQISKQLNIERNISLKHSESVAKLLNHITLNKSTSNRESWNLKNRFSLEEDKKTIKGTPI